MLEGSPTRIVENGLLVLGDIKKGKMSHDKFFAKMRQYGVRHLGQVHHLLVADGEFSVLLFPHDKTQYGLPIFPKEFQAAKTIEDRQPYCCMHCGYVEYISELSKACSRFHHSIGWAEALKSKIVH